MANDATPVPPPEALAPSPKKDTVPRANLIDLNENLKVESDARNWVREIADEAISHRAFRYFELAAGFVFFGCLVWIFSQLYEIRSDYKYIQNLDRFYEQAHDMSDLRRENQRLRDQIELLKPKTRRGG